MGYPMRRPTDEAWDWAEISRRLGHLAVALTGSADLAEELVQQTLATLLARRPDKAAHLGYGRRTMVRLWLDRQRSARRRLARLTRLAAMTDRWHVDGDPLAAEEEVEQLRRAAERMPPRQRAVLVLRVVEGLEYEQIAEVLGCTVQSARSSLHLARARMRQTMGGAS